MISNVSFNMGYNNNPYMILPLNKTNENGMSVKSSTPIQEQPKEIMNNLNDLKAADTDKNNILSLNELKNFEGKTEFVQTILEHMETFAQNSCYKNLQYQNSVKNYQIKN